jgi:DNA-binding response OmpR family regulator
LLDITMPGGNGFLVAEWMQELRETSGVPIIFITGNAQPSVRETASEYGAVAFFEKPFAPKDLLAAIDGVLKLAVAGEPRRY